MTENGRVSFCDRMLERISFCGGKLRWIPCVAHYSWIPFVAECKRDPYVVDYQRIPDVAESIRNLLCGHVQTVLP
eukprot:3049752-Pyramimonas_sp.AAC.1